jgi:hypothetical protein
MADNTSPEAEKEELVLEVLTSMRCRRAAAELGR